MSSVKSPWGDRTAKRRPQNDAERQQIAQRLSEYDAPAALQARQPRDPIPFSGSQSLPLPDMSGMVTSMDGVSLPSPSGYMKGREFEEPGQSWWQKGLEGITLGAVDLTNPASVKERDLTEAEKTEIDRQWRARQATEDALPIGQANLAERGQNRLRNFGMGGTSYQPMMREEYQRWR